MKKIIALGMFASLLNAGSLHAQEKAAIETNAVVTAEPTVAFAETNAMADTNSVADAEPKPPEDPVKNMIARFAFDAGIMPEPTTGGFAIPVVFQRESPASLNGQELGAHMPRLVTGNFGKGLLLESAHANLFSPSQAGAEEISLFQALNGATLTGTTDKPWEGKQALAVATKGEGSEEGMATELKVEKTLYNGATIVPAYYVASAYLKGQGSLKMYLKDMASDTAGEITYVDLADDWKRFACTFGYPFPAMGIGAKHEDDWKTLLPPGTNIEERLQLVIVATDNSKITFFADGLQLEKRETPYAGTRAGPAPHVWVPGGTSLANEMLKIEIQGDYFGRWRKNGTISFWFLPNWDARDGTQDTILQIMPGLTTILQVTPSLMAFQHAGSKIQLAPAGVAFTPSDWQNAWHHIAITWNEEGHWVLYVDSLDYPNDEPMNRPMTTATSMSFGNASAPSTSPNGVIDDLMFFQITLTAEQVQALFAGNLLKPGKTLAPAPAPAPAPAATPAVKSAPVDSSTVDEP